MEKEYIQKQAEKLFNIVEYNIGLIDPYEFRIDKLPYLKSQKYYTLDNELYNMVYNKCKQECSGLTEESEKRICDKHASVVIELNYNKAIIDVLKRMEFNCDMRNANNNEFFILIEDSSEARNELYKMNPRLRERDRFGELVHDDRIIDIDKGVIKKALGVDNKILLFKRQYILETYDCSDELIYLSFLV